MNAQRGFSLLETLAALALLALLLLGVTAALQSITNATRAGAAQGARLDEVRAAHDYLRQTLSGTLAYPWALRGGRHQVVFEGDAAGLSFVAPGPGYLATSGLQLQRIAIAGEAGHKRLEVTFAALGTREASAVVPSEPETLIDHVVSARFAYSGTDENGNPATWQSSWPYPDRLPSMVGIDLELEGGVRWPALAVPLRMDPAAINAREGVARLMMAASP